ncbi:MAG TPA: response regulator [Blastocatellia bacterium]|jgi:DNA-binding NtrC family response regulator
MLEERRAAILIVDDEKLVRDLLCQVLSADYTCITASTVEEAMARLSSGFFDLVIADIGMPDDTGFALCDFIQRTYPETAIIVMSGDVDKEKAALHGALDCIGKPFDLAHVQMVVLRALAYWRLKQNRAAASPPG